MGLDVGCGDVIGKVGSYTNVQKIRHLLLVGLKEYLETETENYDEKVDYLCELIEEPNTVQYQKMDFKKNILFMRDDLDGFFPFIFDIGDSGSMSSREVRRFLETFDIVKEYIHHELKHNDEFYLDFVFQEAVNTSSELTFC